VGPPEGGRNDNPAPAPTLAAFRGLKRLSTALICGSRSRVTLCYSTPVRRLPAAREKGRTYIE
jgi:hypothetical protein